MLDRMTSRCGRIFGASATSVGVYWIGSLEHLFHQLHQLSVAVHHLIPDLFIRDLRAELAGAFDLGCLDLAEVHAGQGAFRLSDEEDVLHPVLLEGDGPIRVVIPDRCEDKKRLRQLGDRLGA